MPVPLFSSRLPWYRPPWLSTEIPASLKPVTRLLVTVGAAVAMPKPWTKIPIGAPPLPRRVQPVIVGEAW